MTERIRRSSRELGRPRPAKDKTTTAMSRAAAPAVLVVRIQNQDLFHEAPRTGRAEDGRAAFRPPPPHNRHGEQIPPPFVRPHRRQDLDQAAADPDPSVA